jgi:uncharacterized membrane protein (UPF0127 family)
MRTVSPVTIRAEDGSVVCERCEVAGSILRRMRGLLGRDGLAPGEGLLLPRTGSVHTFFMRFPIDVVFLDRRRRVVRIAHGLRPWRVAYGFRARSTLELPAGAAAAAGLEAGMTCVVDDTPA